MTDRDALLAAALDRPNNDLPRLVLADYLQDHREDDLGRFVRAGVVAARFRSADLIHDPEFYAATAEIAAVAETGAPARPGGWRPWGSGRPRRPPGSGSGTTSATG